MLGVDAGRPGALVHVADVADLDAAADELVPGGLDVGDDEVEPLRRARLGARDPDPERDRARRARRRELDDPELVAGLVVDVEPEPGLLLVEPLGAVDVRHGNEHELELVVHVSLLVVRALSFVQRTPARKLIGAAMRVSRPSAASARGPARRGAAGARARAR